MKKSMLIIMLSLILTILSMVISQTNQSEQDTENDLVNRKEFNSEAVHADIGGNVVIEKGKNYLLKLSVEGTNDTSYSIKENDNIYIAVKLPNSVQVDREKLKDKNVRTKGHWAGLRIFGPAGEPFSEEYTIPLISTPNSEDHNEVETRFAYLSDEGELELKHFSYSNADINFTPRISRDEVVDIVTDKFGGKVVSMDEEKNKNGKLFYTVEIKQNNNKRMILKVNAETSQVTNID